MRGFFFGVLLALVACGHPAGNGDGGSGGGASSGGGAAGGTGGGSGGGGAIGGGVGGGSSTGGGDSGTSDGGVTCADLEAQMTATLEQAAADGGFLTTTDFTVLLEALDGRTYAHSHGNSSATTVYESASTSKWVAASMIMDQVDDGKLTLATHAHDLLPFWAENTVTLRDLLSFTSGYDKEPLCMDNPVGNFANCVQTIYTNDNPMAPDAGSEFYYASTHLQIAGLMALNAAQVADWGTLFTAWQQKTGLFPTGAWNLPSAMNPRLAGGMHWTGQEYLAFLKALHTGQLLSDTSRAAMFANQRGAATVTYSPTLAGADEDWAYGLGNWLECPDAHDAGTYDCGQGHRDSSPGAYGAYPFIDFDHRYHGIVARQGALGTYTEGVYLFRTIETLAGQWGLAQCQ